MLIDAFEKIDAASPLRALPAVVLSSDKPWQPPWAAKESQMAAGITFADWEASEDLLAASLNAKHVAKTRSGHAIYAYSPQLVIDAIHEVVDAGAAGPGGWRLEAGSSDKLGSCGLRCCDRVGSSAGAQGSPADGHPRLGGAGACRRRCQRPRRYRRRPEDVPGMRRSGDADRRTHCRRMGGWLDMDLRACAGRSRPFSLLRRLQRRRGEAAKADHRRIPGGREANTGVSL